MYIMRHTVGYIVSKVDIKQSAQPFVKVEHSVELQAKYQNY